MPSNDTNAALTSIWRNQLGCGAHLLVPSQSLTKASSDPSFLSFPPRLSLPLPPPQPHPPLLPLPPSLHRTAKTNVKSQDEAQASGFSSQSGRTDGRALRAAAARTHPLPPTVARHTYLVTYLPTCLPLALYSTTTTYFWWRIHYRLCSIFFLFKIVFFFQILHGFRIHPVITLTRKEILSCPQNR